MTQAKAEPLWNFTSHGIWLKPLTALEHVGLISEIQFLPLADTSMDCFICFEPFNLSIHSPLLLCDLGHTACAQCASSIKSCPICRQDSPLEKNPNFALKNLVQAALDGDLCPEITSDQIDLLDKIDEGGCAVVYAAEWFKLPVANQTQEGDEPSCSTKSPCCSPCLWSLLLGRSLRNRNGKSFFFPPPPPTFFSSLTVDYAKQLCQGISYLHSKSVVHGDLKPGNVLIVDDRIRIADFGTSRNIEITSTVPRSGTMTVRYAAPEQFDNKISPQSDIYSLGIILYELLQNQEAFQGMNQYAIMGAKYGGKPLPFDRSLPSSLSNVINQCLQSDPILRPKISQIIDILENLNLVEPQSDGNLGGKSNLINSDHCSESLSSKTHQEVQTGEPYHSTSEFLDLKEKNKTLEIQSRLLTGSK
ncbi:hypothetical protein GEMRC1_010614 [Eukaryota sp. GEM-RC1]